MTVTYIGDNLDAAPEGVVAVKTLFTSGCKYFQVCDSCTAKDFAEYTGREYGFTEVTALIALGHSQTRVPMDCILKDSGYTQPEDMYIFLIAKN